ncbi:MAG TPA: NfeD family protein [Candidatus Scatomorpha pullicola]|mgnify:FL=1|nr:NfeD family protein [Candidatus Scatomorpha pullicola]
MLDLIIQNMSIVWLVLMVLLFIIEAATAGLTVIWFALGALAALIAALFGAQIWLQVLWFLVVSIATLWFTRPLALKYLNGRSVATNADRVVGMEGVVCEDIDNLAGTGAVKLDGKEWTARSDSGANIPSGSVVKVRRIEGVKLIVDAAG